MTSPALRPAPDGVDLDIVVVPRASRTALGGVRDGRLVVRVTAAPVDGAANAALTDLLAKVFRVPKRAVRVVSGDTSRRKTVRIPGVTIDAVRRALADQG